MVIVLVNSVDFLSSALNLLLKYFVRSARRSAIIYGKGRYLGTFSTFLFILLLYNNN